MKANSMALIALPREETMILVCFVNILYYRYKVMATCFTELQTQHAAYGQGTYCDGGIEGIASKLWHNENRAYYPCTLGFV